IDGISLADMGIYHETQFAKAVIENDHRPRDHEHHFRKLEIIAQMNRNGWLEKPDEIVTNKTHRAANEMGSVTRGGETKTRHDLLQLGQWVAFGFELLCLSAFLYRNGQPGALKDKQRVGANK